MTYTSYIDPSIYAVIINAKSAGWVPRPPSITLENPEEAFKKLSQTSSHVNKNKTLDPRFAVSLHERKHFLDLHLSCGLWKLFLSWFHCAANVYALINNLKDKSIILPLYTNTGNLRDNLPIRRTEIANIERICRPVFDNIIDQSVKYAIEVSATLLQYSCFRDMYAFDSRNCDSDSKRQFSHYFVKPIHKFSGDLARAFSYYNFCSWFCLDYDEMRTIEAYYSRQRSIKAIMDRILRTPPFISRITDGLKADSDYLKRISTYFKKVPSKRNQNLIHFLEKLISFRRAVLQDKKLLMELLNNMDFMKTWMASQGPRTPFIVDFGRSLDPNTIITDNYSASKWIIPNDRYFYYNDLLGIRLIEGNKLDDIINQQLLANLLVNPFKIFPFTSKIMEKSVLDIKFGNEGK